MSYFLLWFFIVFSERVRCQHILFLFLVNLYKIRHISFVKWNIHQTLLFVSTFTTYSIWIHWSILVILIFYLIFFSLNIFFNLWFFYLFHFNFHFILLFRYTSSLSSFLTDNFLRCFSKFQFNLFFCFFFSFFLLFLCNSSFSDFFRFLKLLSLRQFRNWEFCNWPCKSSLSLI